MALIKVHQQLTDIPQPEWDALRCCDYPFLSYAYLSALEQSGCVSDDSGWHPLHLTLEDEHGTILAAMPMYLKSHSWGEYVFDWSWQEAYEEAGEEYFPKLVTAIPFTPVSGPRLLYRADVISYDDALQPMLSAVRQLCAQHQFSGWHGLFVEAQHIQRFKPLSVRMDCQYHWYNRGYQHFDDFLATLTSRKRKNLRKEREKVTQQEIELRVIEGAQLTDDDVAVFFEFYQLTYLKRGRYPHLNQDFFESLRQLMPQQIVLILACYQQQPVAGAWFFKDSHTLYGRYWGCSEEFDRLHFEACYYQGIDYCIRHQIAHFDPGAQGEHKIQRGFEPTATWSAHWIESAMFRPAIARFVKEEQQLVEARMAELATYLPYRLQDTQPEL